MRFASSISLILLSMVLATGCDNDSYGDLLVQYQIGSTEMSCASAEIGVSTIQIRLTAPEQSPIVRETGCMRTFDEVLITQIPSAVYTIELEGQDPNGAVIFVGSEQNVAVTEGGVSETGSIRMSTTPPSVDIQWDFETFGGCSAHNVTDIEVVLWRQGTMIDYDDSVACDDDRLIIADGLAADSYNLRMGAINTETQEYEFCYCQDNIVLQPGQPAQIQAMLGDCTAECPAP